MVTPVAKLEVDWNNDGDFGDTGEVIDQARVRSWRVKKYGRDKASQLEGRSVASRLQVILDNRSEDYSSFNTSSPLTGNVLPKRVIRLLHEGRAALFTTANSESLSGGDVLDIGTDDFSIAFWIRPTALAQVGLINKRDRGASTNLGYALELQSDGTLDAFISDGTAVTTISSTTTVSAGAWVFCIFTADRDGNAQWYINAGAAEGATAISSQNGTLGNAIRFALGEGYSGSADRFYGGRMAAVGIWTKLLSSAERTFLYNDGNGRRYAFIGLTGDGSALKTSLQAWYDLDEASGTRSDSENSNDLTDNNTVVDAPGIPNYPTWQGFLLRLIPRVVPGGDKIAILEGIGPIGIINQQEVSIAMQTSKRTDENVSTLLDDAGWATDDRTITTGKTTVTRYAADRKKTLRAIQEMELAENGFFRETKDGRLQFDHRRVRLAAPFLTSQATFSDAGGGALGYSKIRQEDPLPFIFNQFEADVTLYSVGSLATLWTLAEVGGDSPLIIVGQTKAFWARYPNPASATDAFGVDAWTTPVATTDFTANAQSDGGGADLTGDIGISVSKFANVMKISLTNNGSTDAFLTALKARGTPVTTKDPGQISELDATSQTAFGERIWPSRPKYIPTSQEALDWAFYNLAIFKDPNIPVLIEIFASRDQDHFDQFLKRDISDRITITANNNAGLGFSRDFHIEGLEYEMRRPGSPLVMRILAADAEQSSDQWVLGSSALGTSTKLMY
tara:strand:- start:738 stop:2939 length:2202 start_codon:yes stop_codon:yes gene_type:complete